MNDSWWNSYEQIAVIVALCAAIPTAWVAFKRSGFSWDKAFIVSLTWDFSRSWATNITSLAGIIGVAVVSAVTTDFKPFTQPAVKGSYAVTTVLMAAIVVAAPSIYTLLQKKRDDQMVGCVGSFIVASMLTLWGTIAQLLLQGVLLIAFVLEKPGSRFALLLVPLILLVGLALLFPYAVRSINVALVAETKEPPPPAKKLDQLSFEVRKEGAELTEIPSMVITQTTPRKLAML